MAMAQSYLTYAARRKNIAPLFRVRPLSRKKWRNTAHRGCVISISCVISSQIAARQAHNGVTKSWFVAKRLSIDASFQCLAAPCARCAAKWLHHAPLALEVGARRSHTEPKRGGKITYRRNLASMELGREAQCREGWRCKSARTNVRLRCANASLGCGIARIKR